MPGLMPLIIVDLFNHLHEKDREYFRSSRERKLGMSLEQAGAHRFSRVTEFQQSIELLRATVRTQPFLAEVNQTTETTSPSADSCGREA